MLHLLHLALKILDQLSPIALDVDVKHSAVRINPALLLVGDHKVLSDPVTVDRVQRDFELLVFEVEYF